MHDTSLLSRARGALAAALAAALLLAGGAPAAAQVRPDTLRRDTAAIAIDAVVVTSVRATTTTGGASVLLVDPDSLQLAPGATLEQALRTLPFVGVRTNSRGEAEISIRGSESRQAAIVVDGVPLSLGWDHRTDASIIPLTGAQSILLVRGLHSLLYGPNVLGGVIDVGIAHGTAPDDAPRQLGARAGLDHTGARTLSANVGAPVPLAGGDLQLRAGAGYRSRDAFPLPAGVAEPGTGGRRGNSDLRHADGFVALRYHGLGGQWLGVSASGYRAARGVPPELHLLAPRYWRYPDASRLFSALTAGSGYHRTPWGEGDVEASLGVDLGSSEIESFASAAYDRVVGREVADDRTMTLRLTGDHSLGPRGAWWRGALTLSDTRHEETIDGGPRLAYRQRLWSLGTEATVPVSGQTRVSGGLVLDGADTPESGDKPSIERLWSWGGRLGTSGLVLEERIRLHAAVSRRARFPALRELYSGALGRFVPNPELRPERLVGMEAGATAHAGAVEVQAVVFHNRLSDAIVRASAGGGRFRRENRDEIRSTGLELLGGWTRGGLSLHSDVTLQDVSVLDPTAPASEGRPEHQPRIRAGLESRIPLPLALRAVASAAHTGRQFCVHPDLRQDVALDAATRADLGVERTWRIPGAAGGFWSAIRTGAFLGNVGDRTVWDQCGLPQPGRTFRVSVEIG